MRHSLLIFVQRCDTLRSCVPSSWLCHLSSTRNPLCPHTKPFDPSSAPTKYINCLTVSSLSSHPPHLQPLAPWQIILSQETPSRQTHFDATKLYRQPSFTGRVTAIESLAVLQSPPRGLAVLVRFLKLTVRSIRISVSSTGWSSRFGRDANSVLGLMM